MGHDLEGREVFIAGASSGMGRAIAIAAARAGAALILLGRNKAGLDITATLAREAAPGCSIRTLVADASDATALAEAIAGTDLSQVDTLVNSVGTNIPERAFDQLTTESWQQMIDSNLTAAFNLSKIFLPLMRARENGLIIHIASTAARKPDKSGAAYQATKAGVLSLTHALMEEEWQNGIRATAILPGMTDTPLLDRRPTPVTPEARASALRPEDVAAACLFVLRLPPRAHVAELHIGPSQR
ncbi:SDR family oxidoreductase [Chelatococcus asaccharovorans]|uniref:SDR family oxidoreductase n=1 Tax=Chelatococcus asaccharovorans TaxID=28210 RepID=UPI00224C6F52|nr:SDR family oxidoreductase [Chelatococcus asaccharovorans]CAH1649214.1 NADP-dependent 3-hydroxy acid dehydrogenase YdfG [Chelatococcus asaccharovorans]CAH1691410.1 NADP-dependent 3-hydroxy acid dehydrogenase YdfG [Chelatococcus asaccharovorans]